MFNIGGSEMVVLAILALLVFGPEGLPGIIKNVMRTVNAVKAAARDFQTEVNSALEAENERQDLAKRRRKPDPFQEVENVIDPGPSAVTPALAEESESESVPVEPAEESDSVEETPEDLPYQETPPAEESEEEDDDGPRVPMRAAPRRISEERVAEPS